MLAVLFGVLAAAGALIGGASAMRFRDQFHLVLSLSAGLLLGAAFFDLLPESLDLGAGSGIESSALIALTLVGLLAFYLLDHIFGLHPHLEDDDHHHPGHVGFAGASGMGLHSLLDGVGIGVAFQGGAGIGLLVGIAVVAHRFSDGLNSVTMLRHQERDIKRWLGVISVAPLVGVGLSYLFSIPESALAYSLAFFAGMFLYISTADLLPEAHHSHSSRLTVLFTLIGVGFLFLVTRLASV